MDDQVIKLVLQTAGQESIEALQKSTQNYKALLEQLVVSFAKGQIDAEQFQQAQKKLGAEYDRQTVLLQRLNAQLNSDEVDRATQEYEQLRQALANMGATAEIVDDRLDDATEAATRTGKATKETTKSTGAAGQAFLELGRATQDFAQGGIGGVINNVERLGYNLSVVSKEGMNFKEMLASPAGIAGGLTLVATLIYVLGPQIAAFFASFGDGAEKVKLNIGALESLKDELSEVEEKLDKYKDATSLNNEELARANDLLARRAELEAKAAEETERRKRAEQLGELKSPEQEAQEKTQEEYLKQALGGQQGQLITGVEGSMGTAKLDFMRRQQAEIQQQLEASKRLQALPGGGANRAQAEQTRQLEASLTAIGHAINQELVERHAQSVDIVARAFGGDAGALRQIQGAIGRNPQGFTPQQRNVFATKPVTEAQADSAFNKAEAEFEEGQKRYEEAKKRRQAQAEAEADSAFNKAEAEFEEGQKRYEEAKKRRERASKDAARDAEHNATERQRGANEASAHVQDQAQTQAGTIGERTPLDELARALAARLIGQGMSPVDAIARLRHELAPRLRRLGAGPEVASEMASQAFHDARGQIEARRTELLGAGLSHQMGGIGAVAQTVQMLDAEVRNASAWLGHMMMQMNDINQRSKARTQSIQRRGRAR